MQYWQNANDFDPARGSAITWMMTIAHRRAVDRVRTEDLQAERNSIYGATSTEPDSPRNIPLEEAIAADEARTLHASLGHLTDLQRECIEMSYFGGLSYAEVAQRLRTPLPTTKSRIRDGLRRYALCCSQQARRDTHRNLQL